MRGLYQMALPSRFIEELPKDNIEVEETTSRFGGAYSNLETLYQRTSTYDSNYTTPGWQRAQSLSRKPTDPVFRNDLLPDFNNEDNITYVPGDLVFHQKFGEGCITEVDGNKLTIDFKTGGRKRVVDSFVRPL